MIKYNDSAACAIMMWRETLLNDRVVKFYSAHSTAAGRKNQYTRQELVEAF